MKMLRQVYGEIGENVEKYSNTYTYIVYPSVFVMFCIW